MPSKKRSASSTTHEFKFSKDEKVLVLPKQANDDIYEAKVLERQVETKTKDILYKIHYKGWNKRWDEWVDARRLLKINPTNMQIMSEKKAEIKANQGSPAMPNENADEDEYASEESEYTHTNKSKKRKRKSDSHSLQTQQPNKAKKRKISNTRPVETHTSGNANAQSVTEDMALEIKLPTNLKKALITDWENITKKSLLIELPRTNGERITDILSDFEGYAIKSGQDRNIVTEISRGLKDYFNQALKVTLLYKLERSQYNAVVGKYKHLSMDQIYGVEHLCRLFVKLPQLLSPNDLDSDTKLILKQQIEFIIQFILNNRHKYFKAQYVTGNR